MKHLYVVTHPQSQHHTEGRVGGWYDRGLTELGRRQAAAIGERLRELIPEDAPAELYSSDLLRASQTAEAIARCIGVPMQITADLRENSYGEAEGQSQAWLDARFIFPPKSGNRLDHRYGIAGAESRRELAGRMYRAMEGILTSPCAHQIIVTHGFALTFVVAAWVKMPLEAAGYIAVKSTSGGITQLLEDDVFHNRAIVSLNDTTHLEKAEARSAT
jgi:probable phosphoglycerate mutase